MTDAIQKFPVVKAMAALFAATALIVLIGSVASARAAAPADDRFVTTKLPGTPAGRQLQWLIDSAVRLPLSPAEMRAHFAKAFLARPGYSPAQTNAFLSAVFDPAGAQLEGVVATEQRAIVAIVTGRGGRELVITVVVDRAGKIGFPTGITAPSALRPVALPTPSGASPVGTDVLQLADYSRGGRKLMVSRWYPATAAARKLPLADYVSPRLRAVIGLPMVRTHAHVGARPVAGRLPVVLFSPGYGTPRVIYQALAEDLASHGYLVVSVDHPGEAATEYPHGRVDLPALWTDPHDANPEGPLRRAQHARVLDLELIVRRLSAMTRGPLPDLTRIAAVGHSLGGSTSAALMRVDPRIRAGIDLDGSIFGDTAKRGVSRPFLFLGEGGSDSSITALLEHSTGPRLGITIAGLQHMSFSDGPVFSPRGLDVGKWRSSAKDVVIQRVYVRAFLDRYVLGRPSPLLDGPSARYPRVAFIYRDR